MYTVPETAYLKSGRPFFVPDFATPCLLMPHLVIRISRLGHCIAERFAYRYYSAITVGAHFVAGNLLAQARDKGLPWNTATGFDNSATVGEMISVAPQSPGDLPQKSIRICINGEERAVLNTADWMHNVDRLIAEASNWHLLREGDIIFTGHPDAATPVYEGQHIDGYLDEKHVLSFNIK